MTFFLLVALACVTSAEPVSPAADDAATPSDTGDSDLRDTSDSAPAPDADGDGFAAPDGDCDDGDADIFPGAPERCNDQDDDCDGVVDGGLRVPADLPDLATAFAAAPEGGTICLARGVYTGSWTLTGRNLTVEGSEGSYETALDGGGVGPVLHVVGGAVTLRGVQIRGGRAALGAGLFLQDTEVTLDRVSVWMNACEAEVCRGTGILAENTRITANLLWVARNEQSCVGGVCVGAGLVAEDGEGSSFVGTMFEENQQTGSELTGAGAAFFRESGLSFEIVEFDDNVQNVSTPEGSASVTTIGTGLYAEDSTMVGHDVTASRNVVAGDDHANEVIGVGMALARVDGQFAHLVVAHNDAQLVAPAWVSGVGVFLSSGAFVAEDAYFNENAVHSTAWLNVSGAGLRGLDASVMLDGVQIHENGADAEGYNPEFVLMGAGADFERCALVARQLSVRGNDGDSDLPLVGGGLNLLGGTADLTNLVVAGNGAVADSAYGAALASWGGTLTITNADIFRNGVDTGSGTAPVWVSGDVTLDNVAVVQNVGTTAGAFDAGAASSFVVRYGDLFQNSEPAVVGVADPTGTDGNIAVNPGYTDGSSAPTWWDLHLSGSELVDVGDPAILDVDGSRSDVGAYGGPNGSW